MSVNGVVSTVAGSTQGFRDGNVYNALFDTPFGVAASHDGTVYVADTHNHRIRMISASGTVSTVAGSTEGFRDGNTYNALFNRPYGVALSSDGTLFVSDTANHRIRKIATNGTVVTVAGSTGNRDGNTSNALFNKPYGIAVSGDGSLFVADTLNHQIRKIASNGVVSTVAGSTEGFRDGNTYNALFNKPYGIAVSSNGTLFIADTSNHRIRRITTTGIVDTLVGSIKGVRDGNTNNALLEYPYGITVASDRTLFVADALQHQIRKIASNGVVSTVAGTIQGFRDGNTNNALFSTPFGITVSTSGVLFVADTGNHRIRKIY